MEHWHLQGFAKQGSQLPGWVTTVATGIQAIQEAPRAGLVPIFTCTAILTLRLYQHSHLLVITLREQQIQLPPHVHQQLQAPFKSIWHCSDVLPWLLRHHWLHRSAWRSFRQSIWDRMQLSLVNLRPGTSVWTNYVGDNVFLFFPTLGIWKRHQKNIALTWVSPGYDSGSCWK